MRLYRSPRYRQVLAFLARQAGPVATQVVLACLGVPACPSRRQYQAGLMLLRRVVQRGWVTTAPAGAGHSNVVEITAAGRAVAELWAAEAAPLVQIYAGGAGAPKNLRKSRPLPKARSESGSPPAYITCDVCGERMALGDARAMFERTRPAAVTCACGKPLTRLFLTALAQFEDE